jgi:hypothetical protein
MNKTESIAIGLVVGILFPLLVFVLCWWSIAALVMYQVLPLPESVIPSAAFTGLVAGVVLDVLYLRKWIVQFYRIDMWVMALVYLFCSGIAVAFFMGLPLGNIMLGILAGIYVGRRHHHRGGSKELFRSPVKTVSVFTAFVTGLEALPIGLLALDEGILTELLEQIAGLEVAVITSPIGSGVIVLLCVVLMAAQFWCTRTATWWAFGLRVHSQTSGKNRP